MALIMIAFNGVEIASGYGRHEYYLTHRQQVISTKYAVLESVFHFLCACMARLSICLLFLRILRDSVAYKRKWFLYILMSILSIYNVAVITVVLVQCRPTQKLWDGRVQGSCWKQGIQNGFAYMQGGSFCEYIVYRHQD